jgi:hypothetical protein
LDILRVAANDPALAGAEPMALAMLALASSRSGADFDAARYAAAARAMPTNHKFAEAVASTLASIGKSPNRS